MDFFGSEKYFQNRSPNSVIKLENTLNTRTAMEWFTSANNRKYLQAQLIAYHIRMDELSLQSSMAIYGKKKNINSLYNAEVSNTGVKDYTVVLDSVNKDFINYIRVSNGCFDQPLQNTQRVRQYRDQELDQPVIQDGVLTHMTQDDDHYETKRYTDMTASDFQNMDIRRNEAETDLYAQTFGLAMKRSRRNNMQKYMHGRHTDYDLDGLCSKDNNRSSLDNLVRGFNMKDFIRKK